MIERFVFYGGASEQGKQSKLESVYNAKVRAEMLFRSERKRWSQQGFQLFVKASGEFPASVSAQSVYIALKCKQEGVNPLRLGRALYTDSNKIKRIAEVAKVAHVTHGKAVDMLTPISIRRVIITDFSSAQYVMGATEDELTQFLTVTYSDYKARAIKYNDDPDMLEFLLSERWSELENKVRRREYERA